MLNGYHINGNEQTIAMSNFIKEMFSEGSKISSKRVLTALFSLLLIYLAIFDQVEWLIDGLLWFIAGLVGLTVTNKHKSFNKSEAK